MKVSILIPVYNVENFIEKCLNSIINQTMTKDVECIIVNDCTPDKSMDIVHDIIESYSGDIQFRIINHEFNRGLAAARNTGVAAANGDYVIHIDSDDYCEPDMLEKMYRKAIQENADIVVADYYLSFSEKDIYMSSASSSDPNKNIEFIFTGLVSGYLWTKLIRRDLYIKNNLRNKEGLNHSEDFFISVCLFLCAKNVSYIQSAFLHYVRNPNSYVHNMNRKTLEDRIGIYKETRRFLINNNKYKQFEQSLNIHRAILKLHLLYNSTGNLQKKWNIEYKVSSWCILKHQGIKKHWKIALLFASWNMLWVFNLMRGSLNKYHLIRDKSFCPQYYSE